MKTTLFIFIALCIFGANVWADSADSTPFYEVQPNGDTICIVLRGDEFVSWHETIHGNVIDKDNAGVWKYVISDAGALRLSDNIVKQSSMKDLNFVSQKVEIVEQENIHTILVQQREDVIRSLDNDFQPYDPNDAETCNAVRNGTKPKTKDQIKFAPNPRGQFKLLTILVQFSDMKFQDAANARQFYENMMNQPNFHHPNCSIATGSVKDYYQEISSGALSITSTVVGPYTLDNTQRHFSNKASQMVCQAICKAAKDVDMSQFDNNNNGIVDGINVIFAGHCSNDPSYKGKAIKPHQFIILPILRDWLGMVQQILCFSRIVQ